MKRLVSFVLMLSFAIFLTGCSGNDDLYDALDKIRVNVSLPDAQNSYTTLSDAKEDIYNQQMKACELYIKTWQITNSNLFQKKYPKINSSTVEQMCTEKRMELNDEIKTAFYNNLNKILENVGDCKNKPAYIEKAHKNVLSFYNRYYRYIVSENKEKELCNILKYFYEDNNELAQSFIKKNYDQICNAAATVIEENSRSDSEYITYMYDSNTISTALYKVYNNDIPKEITQRIGDATVSLAKKILESKNNMSDADKLVLLKQFGISVDDGNISSSSKNKSNK